MDLEAVALCNLAEFMLSKNIISEEVVHDIKDELRRTKYADLNILMDGVNLRLSKRYSMKLTLNAANDSLCLYLGDRVENYHVQACVPVWHSQSRSQLYLQLLGELRSYDLSKIDKTTGVHL